MTELMQSLLGKSKDKIDDDLLANKADLRNLEDDELVELVKQGKVDKRELTDSWICPTCWNKSHNQVLYGDCSRMVVFENYLIEAMLVDDPRANGHMIISSQAHYKDWSEASAKVRHEIDDFMAVAIPAIKEVYGAGGVYPCSMCDGRNNHLHFQLIPRHYGEKRGSTNFVKPRQVYVHDQAKVDRLRKIFKKWDEDRKKPPQEPTGRLRS